MNGKVKIILILSILAVAAYGTYEFTGPLKDIGGRWTISRMTHVVNDGNGVPQLDTLDDLTTFIAGTANETEVTDDGDGSVTVGILDPLIVSKGGTGAATLTDGGIVLGSGTSPVTVLAQATNGQLPIGSTGGDPVLATLTGVANETDITNGAGSITVGIVDPLIVAKGGTGAATLTDGGLMLGSGTDAVTVLGVAANGQIPIGDGATDPVLNEIDGTANQVIVTNGAGTITLSTPQDIHTGASPTFADMTLSAPSNIYALSHDSFADFLATEHYAWASNISGTATIDANNVTDFTISGQVAGDIIYHDGDNWVRLAKGTADQVLQMNAGATAPEWDTGGAGYTDLTEFVDQTAWRVFYSNASGDVTELAFGADGTYLRSNGASSAPTFTTPSGSGDMLKSVYDVLDDGFVDANDTTYAASWNGNINAPSMNAVYDKIETISAGGDSISIDSVAVVDPDFQDTTTINITDTSNVVTMDVIADSIDSQHYAAASIDNEHLADDAVNSAEIATNAVKLDALDVSDVSDDIAGDIAEGELADDSILEADLKAVDVSADEDILTRETTTGDFEWHSAAELGIGTATSITDGLIIEPDLDADVAPADGDFLQYDLTGTNFTWRSATETKTDLSLDNVENTQLSTWTGAATITTVGTIGTGTWQGTAIADAYIPDDITITGLGVATSITDDLIINADLNIDVEAVDGDFLQYDSTGDNFTWRSAAETLSDIGAEPAGVAAADITDLHAGTDITADLEEETHASEHQDAGADEIAVTAGMMNAGTGASSSTYWRGDNTWATPGGSGDMTKAVYDVLDDGFVDANDTAYNATTWDGNINAPSMNAVRDKFEGLSGTGTMTTVKSGDTPVGDADIVTLDFDSGPFTATEAPDTEIQIDLKDDGVDSQHYVAASIDNEHLADDAVNSAEIATNAVKLDALDVSDVSDDIAGDIAEGELADDSILEADLKAVDVSADEDILTRETTTGDFEWHSAAEMGIGVATSITDDLIINADLNIDVEAIDGDYLQYDSTGDNFTWRDASEVLSDIGAEPAGVAAADITDLHAGTDITADLEEETHASEHQDAGADEIAVTAGMMNAGTGASASTYWRGDNTWATPGGSGDMTKAVYDVLDDGFVDANDTTYAASWNGNINAPSMNAVYDKIETLGAGTDEKVGVDSGATADYIGAANNDGVLRVEATELSYADGGNFVTLGIADDGVDSIHYAALSIDNEHIATGTVEADKLEATNAITNGYSPVADTISGGVTWTDVGDISNTAYDATSWDGNLDAASKDAIRDKIETMAGGAPINAQYLVSAADGTLTAEDVVTEGFAIDYTNGAGTGTFAFDPTEITGGTTWDDAGEASVIWTWDVTAGDPSITFGNGVVNVSSGTLQQAGNAVYYATGTDVPDADVADDITVNNTTSVATTGLISTTGNAITFGDGTTGDPVLTFDSGADGTITWDQDASDWLVSGDSLQFTTLGTIKVNGGDAAIYAAGATSNASLSADNNVYINLDQDVSGDESFIIRDGADATLLQISETGAWTLASSTAIDGGGITSVEMPNGTNPTTDAAGEVAVDSDDDMIEFYGTASRVLPALQTISKTIIDPDTVQGISDAVPLLHVVDDWAPGGITIKDIHLSANASNSASYTIEEWSAPDTWASDVETVAFSAALTAEDDGTLADASIATNSWVMLDLDTTALNWATVTFTYYINSFD